MNVDSLLDRAAGVTGAKNDSALADALGVSRQALSSYRKGHRIPDIVTCEKLAKMAGIKPLDVVLELSAQREISRDAKAVWRRLASAAIVLLLVGIGHADGALATSTKTSIADLNNSQGMHYAKWWKALHGVFRSICAKVRGLMTPERFHACIA